MARSVGFKLTSARFEAEGSIQLSYERIISRGIALPLPCAGMQPDTRVFWRRALLPTQIPFQERAS